MSANTKLRTEQLQSTARKIVVDSKPDLSQSVAILPLAKILIEMEGCKIDAAKRHIAKAIRQRYVWAKANGLIPDTPATQPEVNHGGARDGAGRPKNSKGARMFYAIEYAYGSNVINKGGRADKVYKFERKAARDKFVSDGNQYVGAGERKAIKPSESQRQAAEEYTEESDYQLSQVAEDEIAYRQEMMG